jgi:hypothetical protein
MVGLDFFGSFFTAPPRSRYGRARSMEKRKEKKFTTHFVLYKKRLDDKNPPLPRESTRVAIAGYYYSFSVFWLRVGFAVLPHGTIVRQVGLYRVPLLSTKYEGRS